MSGSIQLASTHTDHLDCSIHNNSLFLTGNSEELQLWDIRNHSKSLMGIKYTGANQVEFSKANANHIIISKDNSIEYLSLSDFKSTENIENNGINVN